ncbi:Phenylalanyl-tRNA synthetase alpha chain [Mycoplasmoides gallisepticum NC08_2008.031-4-3P]|uniref:phenylalanine--tRNA ligase subunit alpha n=1 Tax=Mycoplasmoides gallisepticum TaxID=2096 RepID=UPI0002778EF2|nr:phenylalanine--tRNA ligase subunit alpha [Mycoplasmoides gallisepticum]AFP81250.1 Phenylalanyl-tRNA synthetase alpha chain [Mycoplasmoides gallisepticum NC08_2008.031-4-3P]
MDQIKKIIDNFKQTISSVDNQKELIVTKNIFVKKHVTPLFQQLRELKELAVKKAFGKELNFLQEAIQELFEEKNQQLVINLDQNQKPAYDLMIPALDLVDGSIHPLNLVVNQIVDFFKKFNFTIVNYPELVTTKHCFDDLNIPLDHPGRSKTDTFYVSDKQLLRTHCTAGTIEAIAAMNKHKDIRVISFGNVYRNDTDDATHSHQFMQMDFMWVNKDLSLANLKWFVTKFIEHMFGNDLKTRFRLSHFPFTEPSFEVDVECWNCQSGCFLCKKTRWIEIMGSGILHPKVLEAAHIDPEKMVGIAAGIGIERIAMLKNNITDIRDFYLNDFRFIKQFYE